MKWNDLKFYVISLSVSLVVGLLSGWRLVKNLGNGGYISSLAIFQNKMFAFLFGMTMCENKNLLNIVSFFFLLKINADEIINGFLLYLCAFLMELIISGRAFFIRYLTYSYFEITGICQRFHWLIQLFVPNSIRPIEWNYLESIYLLWQFWYLKYLKECLLRNLDEKMINISAA